ncbi:MAG: gephyrin-like molybdotransferase Glp, partial [Actinomycetota bacterium]
MTPLDEVRAHVLSRLPAPVAVDGYAVIAADTASSPRVLRVTGEMAAGAVHTDEVRPGCAVRIMTGAPLPAGCDAVVMVEDTENPGDGTVRVLRAVEAGASIRRAGSDVRVGDVPLRAGTVVTPAVQAVLATLNARTVRVLRRLTVGVMSTGDELVDDGSPLGPGQIRESNRTMLLRLVRAAGAEAVDLGIVRDDEEVLESAIRSAVSGGIDVLVTSGGVSMGDYDVVQAVLGRVADMSGVQIAMKPAKPFAFGTVTAATGRVVPVFGLPGNPVSSLMSFELIARPALRQMMGHPQPYRPVVRAILDEAVARRP